MPECQVLLPLETSQSQDGTLRHALASSALWSLALALMLASGCGDEEPDERAPSRVGESCSADQPCDAGLACLQTELRCAVICAIGSDDCGQGIACQPAGEQGFCPLPPAS